MEFLAVFFLGGLESEESSFPGREHATKHRNLGLVDVLKQQSRSFDVAGLADIRGNFIFGVDRFADPAEFLLVLQMSYEFSEIPERHVRRSKFRRFHPAFVCAPSSALKTLCGNSGKSLILT